MLTTDWTYGAEHEWADHPLDRVLPQDYGRDHRDVTIVNSNGIANDPRGRTWRFGGEINTPPTDSIEGQVDCLRELKLHLPEATINYRSNLHLHIRVPGLKDDLGQLKDVQFYIHSNMRKVLAQIEPLPRPKLGFNSSNPKEEYLFNGEEYEGALRRWRRRRVSHQTLLTPTRLAGQISAKTIEEFFQREVPQSKEGKPLWHLQPRLCVNVRQLLETDTIEFRHFPGTMGNDILRNSLTWCRDFLYAAFMNAPIDELLNKYKGVTFPPFPLYNHAMEKRYRLTCHDHTLTREQIEVNIQKILGVRP